MHKLIVPTVNIIPGILTSTGSAAFVRLLNTGVLNRSLGGAEVAQPGQWFRGTPGIGDYQAMMQYVSGVFFGNLLDTWLVIPGATLIWGASGSPSAALGILHIRKGGSGGPLVSAEYSFIVP